MHNKCHNEFKNLNTKIVNNITNYYQVNLTGKKKKLTGFKYRDLCKYIVHDTNRDSKKKKKINGV